MTDIASAVLRKAKCKSAAQAVAVAQAVNEIRVHCPRVRDQLYPVEMRMWKEANRLKKAKGRP